MGCGQSKPYNMPKATGWCSERTIPGSQIQNCVTAIQSLTTATSKALVTTSIKLIPQSLWVRVNMKQVQLKPFSHSSTAPSPHLVSGKKSEVRKKNLDASEPFSAKMGTKAGSRRNQVNLSTRMPACYFANSRVKALYIGKTVWGRKLIFTTETYLP